ncbi:MAG: hypothetical protein R3F07_18120 [Opitutaceae bacterium]
MKVTLISVLALGLAGCATVPSDVYYGPLVDDVGYSALNTGPNEWSVRYTGDTHMTGSTVRDLTLLACADLAAGSGCGWFVVNEKVDESGSILHGTSFSGPAREQTSTGYSGGVDKLSGTMSSETSFISQYRYEIRCYREQPADPGAFESARVASELRAKYGISGLNTTGSQVPKE